MLPPQDRPTSWARRVEAWNFSKEERRLPAHSMATWATAPSMQPPETEPARRPSSATAMTDPGTRGEEPQVFVTWASATARPSSNHRRTSEATSRMISPPLDRQGQSPCPTDSSLQFVASEAVLVGQVLVGVALGHLGAGPLAVGRVAGGAGRALGLAVHDFGNVAGDAVDGTYSPSL